MANKEGIPLGYPFLRLRFVPVLFGRVFQILLFPVLNHLEEGARLLLRLGEVVVNAVAALLGRGTGDDTPVIGDELEGFTDQIDRVIVRSPASSI